MELRTEETLSSGDDENLAYQLTQHLTHDLEKGERGYLTKGSLPLSLSPRDMPQPNVYLGDVDRVIDIMQGLVQYGKGIPCIQLQESWIPVAPNLLAPRDGAPKARFGLGERASPDVKLFSNEEGCGLFRGGLVRFISSRLAGSRSPDPRPSPGIKFTVHTRKKGLRIHYAPSCFIDEQEVFGVPTTPVTNWIKPGTYVFGAVGPGVPFMFEDDAPCRIPPLREYRFVSI